MNEDVQALFQRHDAFYEVSAYYVIAMKRRLHAGFDVDIYAARIDHAGPFMPPPKDYARGSASLTAIAKRVADDVNGACCVEAFPFPTSATFGVRGHAGEPAAMFRIRISLSLPPARSIGAPESQALAEVERQLKTLGVVRR
jgi:hypothetical protein